MLNDSRQFASVDFVEKGNWGQACDLCDFGFDRISCSARENVETHDLAADFIEQFGTATIENRRIASGLTPVLRFTNHASIVSIRKRAGLYWRRESRQTSQTRTRPFRSAPLRFA